MNVEALHTYLSAVASKRFALGHYDCVRFVAEALFIGWDKDYLGVLDYNDRRTAVRRLRKAGGLAAACDDALGERIPWNDLKTGDVAYFDDPHATIGLVMPDYVAIKIGVTIYRGNVTHCEFGWRP